MSFSASQISTAELCLRKWAFLKIDGEKPPPNRYAKHGIETHAQVAKWLAEKVPPDDTHEGKTAAALIPYLPPPQAVQPRFVEVRFGMKLAGLDFVGFVDLFHPEHARRPRVYDHKTTSGLQWAKTPAELVGDVQATLYAFWGMIHSSADVLDLQWTYATRDKRPKVQVVEQTVTKAEIRPRLEQTRDTALELQALLDEPGLRALDVPYDAAGCEAFGGCPFREKCNLSPQERIKSVMSQGEQKESFLARLRSRQAGGAPEGATPHPPPATPSPAAPSAATAVNPPAPPPAPETPPAPTTAEPAAAPAGPPATLAGEKVSAAKNKIAVETDLARLNAWAEADTRKTVHKAIAARIGELGGNAPPAAPSAAETPPAPETPAEPPPAPAEAPSPPPAPATPAPAAATPAQAELAKMHPGGTSPGISSPPAGVPSDAELERRRELAKSAVANAGGFVLFVNCGPVKAPNGDARPELASTRIAHVLRELEKATGVKHYKVIDYGKGVGIFAAAVARDLIERPPVGAVMINTASREALDALQAFEAAAHTVIHGHSV